VFSILALLFVAGLIGGVLGVIGGVLGVIGHGIYKEPIPFFLISGAFIIIVVGVVGGYKITRTISEKSSKRVCPIIYIEK